MTKVIDLRSDTVTQPTEEMRDAMRNAVVGDDYFRDDPTVIELETMAATILGKEAALFVASGTMGNLVSIMAGMQRGESLIVEADAHVYRSEAGHLGSVCGVVPKRVKGASGIMTAEDVEAAIYGEGVLLPTTSMICIENTHNAGGGTCYTVEDMAQMRAVADRHGLRIHVDGARIFNAAIALGVEAKALAADADSLTFCLSKGLACPFGAVVVGEEAFIAKCRKMRQMVGGGMRQAGIMAAAGVYALKNMVDRLVDDHKNARLLAEGLHALGLEVDLEAVQSNIVFANASRTRLGSSGLAEAIRAKGLLVNMPGSNGRIRFVTHWEISTEDIKRALAIVADALSAS
ncbi:MAG: L-allo-threonine aldolase [Firmicutes bacterium ADurb.Bin506]|nr:MAG: L-allo-threonine aldolase [Firmicutes bacterium ADurb.Bin506]